MIDALVSGKFIKQPELKVSKNDTPYTNFLLSVSVGEADNIVVSGIAFGDYAEWIAKLGKGDAISVTGALKPTEWQDKATNETRHGLSVTVSDVLSVYDIKKRRKPEPSDISTQQDKPPYNVSKPNDRPFDDPIEF
jgi:single-stranded DNA-binding protein